MNINSVEDIKKIVGQMHDSEFKGDDLSYDEGSKTFTLKSRCPKTNKAFTLKIYNVDTYSPINLNKINEGKGLGGVFNEITTANNGLELTIVSQDLKIKLNLSELNGKLETSN